jgi:hypothetical protein
MFRVCRVDLGAYSLVRMQVGMCILNKARLSPREGRG